jgi:hypothetical protein
VPVRRFRYGPIEARVEDVGEGVPPWRETVGRPVHRYRVTVKGPGGTHTTSAWGSLTEYETGEFDHSGIAEMVVDELASAAADPDEFIDIVIGEERGRRALERGKDAEKVVAAARRIGHDALFRAQEMIRAEEEGRSGGGGGSPEEWRPGR